MKTLLLLLFISFNLCCQNKNDQKAKLHIEKYGTSLLQSDFLLYADSININSIKEGIVNSFNIYDESNNKILHIDGEELAEFNFDFFLTGLNRILSKRSFNLEIKTADDYEQSNEIYLNGEKIQLYSKDNITDYSYRDIGPRVFFKKLNELVKKQKINESFFLLYGDNDLHCLLLTEEQFKIISEYYKNVPNELPYKP